MIFAFLTTFTLAIGLSMDALAAAVMQGIALKTPSWRDALRVGLAFGVAQALMPLLGWSASQALGDTIRDYDHWVAFALLCGIGLHMIHEGYQAEGPKEGVAGNRKLLLLALATSIDAAAAGLTFGFLQTSLWATCLIIGATTLVLSVMGVRCGQYAGIQLGKKAEYCGGAILMLLGLKILFEHLSAT